MVGKSIEENIESKNVNFRNAIKHVFYVAKTFGLIPYSSVAYYKHKKLEFSFIGNVHTLSFLTFYVCSYHFLSAITYFDEKGFRSGGISNINDIK